MKRNPSLLWAIFRMDGYVVDTITIDDSQHTYDPRFHSLPCTKIMSDSSKYSLPLTPDTSNPGDSG